MKDNTVFFFFQQNISEPHKLSTLTTDTQKQCLNNLSHTDAIKRSTECLEPDIASVDFTELKHVSLFSGSNFQHHFLSRFLRPSVYFSNKKIWKDSVMIYSEKQDISYSGPCFSCTGKVLSKL